MRANLVDRRTRRHTGRVAATTLVALSALAATAAIAGCGTRVGGAPGQATAARAVTAKPSSQVRNSAPSGQPAPPLAAGQVGTLPQVPWGEVGPGWALAQYSTGSNQVAGPVTLYLLDPEGGLYQLYRWPATTQPWVLLAWSGDKGRALLEEMGTSQPTLHQLTIATGQITTFTLPATVTQVLGYTRPNGENILVDQHGVVRYSLTGVQQARLSDGTEFAAAVSSPDGQTEIVNGGTGVELVSNAGGVVRFLPVPGTDATLGGCTPERWWNTADILAACTQSGALGPRLWLVPVSGAAPVALTQARMTGAPDFGDVDAWQLPTGLYLQAEAPCGPPFIARQAANGTAVPIVLPGSSGNVVIAVSGDRMLVQGFTECIPGSSLAWFNPASGGVQHVLTEQPKTIGVVSAIPYDDDGEQPPPQG